MDSFYSVFVLDADLMVTLSAEGGVSLLYPSKHLAGVQCSLRGSNTPQANYEFAAFTRLLKEQKKDFNEYYVLKTNKSFAS